jgi:menaquinone-dependent protoporphyrinogen IX oxidase
MEDPVPNNAANINTTTGQVLETDVRFGKFIRRNAGNFDWIAGSAAVYNNRWNAGTEAFPVKAAADPCPEGWRVPTRTEWTSTIIDSSGIYSMYWSSTNSYFLHCHSTLIMSSNTAVHSYGLSVRCISE